MEHLIANVEALIHVAKTIAEYVLILPIVTALIYRFVNRD